MSLRHLGVLGACCWLLGLAGCGHQVTRISDGATHFERPISPAAYAAYAQARLAERAGDRTAAEAAYREVIRLDGDADEAYIQLGVMACPRDARAAKKAFEHAEQTNPKSAELYVARAECALSRKEFALAVASAEAALRRAPNNPQVSHLMVRAQQANGNRQEALRYAWAHVAMFPHDRSGWLGLAELVGKNTAQSGQLQYRAAAGLPMQYDYLLLDPPSASGASARKIDTTRQAQLDLDRAILAGDAPRAQRAARQLRLGVMQMVARAQDLGALDFAQAQAALAGSIQADDPAIWQEQLLLADVLNDEEQFLRLLKRPSKWTSEPSPGDRAKPIDWTKLLEVIERRTGVSLGRGK